MSTRHIWERYNITESTQEGRQTVSIIRNTGGPITGGRDYSYDPNSKTFTLSGVTETMSSFTELNGAGIRYNPYLSPGNIATGLREIYEAYRNDDLSYYLCKEVDGQFVGDLQVYPNGGFYRHYVQTTQSQGSKIDDVSGAQSLYPNNGVSGSYWYVYSGSDSIDPTSISTVVDRWLCIGQQLTITTSPSTSIQYGGTISYQYQVQLNGSSWTNIGSKTTATSIDYTVPDGTTSIAFRVQASDNMGFTSADWVQSETYAVSKYVPGIAQKLHRKNASGEYDLVHMETDTQIVLMNSGSTLEDELVKIISEIERRGG